RSTYKRREVAAVRASRAGGGAAGARWAVGAATACRQKNQPPTAPTNITTICVAGLANNNSARHDTAASARRGQSGLRLRAILHTACATIATAVSTSPWRTGRNSSRSACGGSAVTATANVYINSAEGRVKPTQAARAPFQPALRMPTRKPTWLLVG